MLEAMVAAEDKQLARIRNVGIMAHIDAGKTTVTERMLFYADVTRKFGEVHEGDTIMDFMDQRQLEHLTARDYNINLIDTPGHVDFTIEVERSLRVLDGAVAVFDGVAGVEAQANRYHVPRLVFVNKLDREGADLDITVKGLIDRMKCVPLILQLPLGKCASFVGIVDLIDMKVVLYDQDDDGRSFTYLDLDDDLATEAISSCGLDPSSVRRDAHKARETLIEQVGEFDDDVLSKYLEGKLSMEDIPSSLLKAALREETLKGGAERVCVLVGSAFKNKGVQVCEGDGIEVRVEGGEDQDGEEGEEEEEACGADTPACSKKKSKKPQDIVHIERAPSRKEKFLAFAFKVVTDRHVGDLVYIRCYSGVLESKSSIKNVTKDIAERPSKILRVMAEDYEEIEELGAGDIAALVGLKQTGTGDTLVLSSEKQVACTKLERNYGVKAVAGKIQITYRESIKSKVQKRYSYDAVFKGKRTQAEFLITVEPNDEESNVIDASKAAVGSPEFSEADAEEAVENGISAALTAGPLLGMPILRTRVTVDEVKTSADTTLSALSLGASMAVKTCIMEANPTKLQPIMHVEVTALESHVGTVMSDLTSNRNADIERLDTLPDGRQIIKAMVPLEDMVGYASELRSSTGGKASFSLVFSHFQ
ncbi:hypothetical protein GUITHDRAFT_99482 [Guillardia theta CCMP2712]|uniref:Tr-type G domain-containing protein n=1 Tax=Guillardia theta (strain CCMP2712) TaxID=905079 RepID=L1K2P1_GUITC|nr:hypothetical protein GUITHDRAFT_99482 [Guillardia theta CCMP2712]EKX54832.1 hypothetical protein GUITHDRAFT_99482 [Guillardia theta CCMP2712]|eukprot:XP_005841812.1 hypothetical protein GUITHDRAFT_99482 [Guillardia theta CCMP2712]